MSSAVNIYETYVCGDTCIDYSGGSQRIRQPGTRMSNVDDTYTGTSSVGNVATLSHPNLMTIHLPQQSSPSASHQPSPSPSVSQQPSPSASQKPSPSKSSGIFKLWMVIPLLLAILLVVFLIVRRNF